MDLSTPAEAGSLQRDQDRDAMWSAVLRTPARARLYSWDLALESAKPIWSAVAMPPLSPTEKKL